MEREKIKNKRSIHVLFIAQILKKTEILIGGSKHLSARPLTKPLEFFVHLPSKHQTKHLEITRERPEGVPEHGPNIPFNEEVTVPSTTIAN